MRKQFAKNGTHRLPWKPEAYRLWLDFLKAASRDTAIQVHTKLYKGWGDIPAIDFDELLNSKGETLFAVERSAEEITTSGQWNSHSKNRNRITVSIPLDCNVRDALEDVRKLLGQRAGGVRARNTIGASGAQYSISARNLKYPHLRQLLRIYEYWLDSGKDLDATAKRYHSWAKETNAKRRKWRERRKAAGKSPYWVTVPEAGWETYIKSDADSQRRAMRRYIHKATTIAENVAKGVFPGKF